MKIKKEWFDEWFDSPYYHILYKHRDYEEARTFIDNLADYFSFLPEHRIMDLACGKGRHSIYLNKKGFDVTGVDLSVQNINFANQYANPHLRFYTHDMRKVFKENAFDFVLNMFTSFGYFEDDKDNERAICAITKSLVAGGKLMIDFLNPEKVINNLVPSEIKKIDEIHFQISKKYEDGFILKDINFSDMGEDYSFQERVKAIKQEDFMKYFDKANLKLVDIFGDYELNAYDENVSDRMIFVMKKSS